MLFYTLLTLSCAAPPPRAPAAQTVTAEGFSCTLHPEGAVRCEGRPPTPAGGAVLAPAGTTQLAATRGALCGIAPEGVWCWIQGHRVEVTGTAGALQLALDGALHPNGRAPEFYSAIGCAILPGERLRCWHMHASHGASGWSPGTAAQPAEAPAFAVPGFSDDLRWSAPRVQHQNGLPFQGEGRVCATRAGEGTWCGGSRGALPFQQEPR